MLIVIPSALIHKPVLVLSLARLKKRYAEAVIRIICPAPPEFEDLTDDRVRVSADMEFAVVSKEELERTLTPAKSHLSAWYYQQFLKYSVIAKLRNDRVLLLDADSILLRDIRCAPNVLFTSREWNKGYFDTFRILFGDEAPLTASAIVNFMWFEPKALRQMLSEIESRHGDLWWKVLVSIANECTADRAFSEYETYANWFSLRRGPHAEIPIALFRRGDLLIGPGVDHAKAIDIAQASGYDAIAFELNHAGGLIRRCLAHILLALKIGYW